MYPAESSTQNRFSSLTETNLTSKKHRFSLSKFYILAAFVALSLAGCNGTNTGDPGTVDNAQECPNGGVFKDGGCKNPDSCNDSARCIPGYTCQNSQCKPDVVCSGNSGCSAGICQDGVCVNPPVCLNSEYCIKGFLCDLRDGSATQNKCVRPTCPQDCTRGICDLATNTCVSRTRCTAATVDTDCVLGDVCAEGFCKSKEAVCQKLDCDSKAGVCDPEKNTTKCVDKDQCTKNEECAAGKFCTGNAVTPGKCEINYCSGKGSVCQDGGVCVPDAVTGTWKCENPTDCTKGETCQNGYSCVGTTCLEQGKECGPTPCSGVRQCVYDSSTRTAACRENAQGTCHSFSDCNDDRICRAGQCTEAPTPKCADDDLEPNNSEAKATNFYTIPEYKRNSTNLCKGDEDWYAYKVDKEGNLVVQVTINPEDVGTKEVKVQLLRKAGSTTTEVKSGTNVEGEKVKGAIEISTEITDSLSFGDYYVVVSDKEGKELAIRYKLNIALAPKELFSACENATSVTLNPDGRGGVISDRVEGTLDDSSASDKLPKGVEYRCLNKKDLSSGTKVYAFTLEERSYVTVNAQSSGNRNTDVVLAMRSVCTDSASESACVNDVSPDEFKIEKLNKILEKGTHYLFVTSPKASDANGFALTIQATPATCDPNSSKVNKCDPSGNNLIVCNEKNTGEELKYCVNGCENDACKTAPGDVCNSAIEVTKESPYSGKLFVENYNNSYDEGTACSKITDAAMTSGKDIVFKVKDVPAGHAVQVQVKGKGQKAVYFTRNTCSNIANCTNAKEELTHAGTETTLRTSYKNDSSAPADVFVFLDYNETGTVGVGRIPTTLDVEIKISDEQTTCSAGATKCVKGETIVTCGDFGDKWDGPSFFCGSIGCNMAQTGCEIPDNDKCNGAKLLESGKQVTGDISVFSNTSDPISCEDVGTINWKGRKDAMYKVEAKKGKAYTITLKSNDNTTFKPYMWIIEESSCTNSGEILSESCLWGKNKSTDFADEQFEFYAREDKNYIIVVESEDKTKDGLFKIVMTETVPSNPPNTIIGCNAAGDKIEYFDNNGQPAAWPCQCIKGEKSCKLEEGKFCMDAKTLYDYTTATATAFSSDEVAVSDSFGKDLPDLKGGKIDQCFFDSYWGEMKGVDYFYKFKLNANDAVKVDYKTGGGDSKGNVVFFQKEVNCGDPNFCVGSIEGRGSNEISYKAGDEPETVYLVVKYKPEIISSWNGNTFRIDGEVIPSAECVPNRTSCKDPSTSNDLYVCNEDGKIAKTLTCVEGCLDGRCIAPSSKGNVCSDAVDAGTGGVFIAYNGSSYSVTTDNAEPSCIDSEGDDVFYKVHAKQGDIIRASAHALTEAQVSLYIISNCDDVNASCLVGKKASDEWFKNGPRIDFPVDEEGDYYVVVDAPSKLYKGPSYVSINVEQASCKDEEPVECDSGVIKYCHNGKERTFACSTSKCATSSACEIAAGEYCQDAIPLDTSTTGQLITLSNQSVKSSESHVALPVFNNVSGACAFPFSPEGGENYYSLSLTKGQKVKITSKIAAWNYTTYVMTGCTRKDTCMYATPSMNDKDQTIEFEAVEDGTYYYVVAKKTPSTSTPTFDIKYEITEASAVSGCVPYQTYCENETTLKQCTPQGREVSVSCDCKHNTCSFDPSLVDECSTAPEIASGFATLLPDNFGTNKLGGTPSCIGAEIDGQDSFFNIKLPPYKTLRVVVKPNNILDHVGIYLLKDGCNISSCVKGVHSELGEENYKTLVYTAGKDEENLTIGIDQVERGAWNEPANSRLLWVSIDEPECDPNSEKGFKCESGQLKYCDKLSKNHKFQTCKQSACVSEGDTAFCFDGDATSCYEAQKITISSDKGSVTGDLGTATSSNSSLTNGNFCTDNPGTETGGKDLVYRVTVPAGKKLKATVTSTATPPEDLAVYALEGCGGTTCLAGADEHADGTQEESFTTGELSTTENKTVLIYVDSAGTKEATGTFKLDVAIVD